MVFLLPNSLLDIHTGDALVTSASASPGGMDAMTVPRRESILSLSRSYHSHISLIQRHHHDTALTHVSRLLSSISSTTFCPSFSFFPMARGILVS